MQKPEPWSFTVTSIVLFLFLLHCLSAARNYNEWLFVILVDDVENNYVFWICCKWFFSFGANDKKLLGYYKRKSNNGWTFGDTYSIQFEMEMLTMKWVKGGKCFFAVRFTDKYYVRRQKKWQKVEKKESNLVPRIENTSVEHPSHANKQHAATS